MFVQFLFQNDDSSSAKSQDHSETVLPVLSAQGRRLNKEAWNTESDLDPVHHFRDELWSVLALTNAAVAEWEQPRTKPAPPDTGGVEDVIVADSWSWSSSPHTFACVLYFV